MKKRLRKNNDDHFSSHNIPYSSTACNNDDQHHSNHYAMGCQSNIMLQSSMNNDRKYEHQPRPQMINMSISSSMAMPQSNSTNSSSMQTAASSMTGSCSTTSTTQSQFDYIVSFPPDMLAENIHNEIPTIMANNFACVPLQRQQLTRGTSDASGHFGNFDHHQHLQAQHADLITMTTAAAEEESLKLDREYNHYNWEVTLESLSGDVSFPFLDFQA